MHAVLSAIPPVAPSNLQSVDNPDGTGTLTWTDSSLSETAFVVEKLENGGGTWEWVGQIDRVLTVPNTTGGVETFTDPEYVSGDQYRVFAQNTVGDTWNYADPNLNEIVNGGFPTITTKSAYAYVVVVQPPAAP